MLFVQGAGGKTSPMVLDNKLYRCCTVKLAEAVKQAVVVAKDLKVGARGKSG